MLRSGLPSHARGNSVTDNPLPVSRARLLLENTVANYAYVILMGVVTVVLTPIYVRTLGPSQWGMVALCMTLQGILLMLDLGISQVMPREIARAGRSTAGVLYRQFLGLYLTIGVVVGLGGQAIAPEVTALLAGTPAPDADLVLATRLVMVQFMFQFANNAAIGYWNGLELQKQANLRLAAFGVLKHGAALLAITRLDASVVAYMVPFALVCAIEFGANLVAVRASGRARPATATTGPTTAELLRTISGFSVAVVPGMLTSQIDRIFLARTVPPDAFGAYVVAANLALAMLQLQAPLQRAFGPRIMRADADSPRTTRQLLGLVLAFCVLPCLLMAALAVPLMQLWLGVSDIASNAAPVFRWVLVAVAMNAVYSVAYLHLLRSDAYAKVAGLNAGIVLLQALALAMFGEHLSLMAGAMSWLICGSVQLLVALAVLRRVLR